MRPSLSTKNPDPVPRPTWIITVAGSTRLAISTLLALGGGGATGVRVTPGSAEGLAEAAEEGEACRASAAPPYPAAPPITSAVSAATAITEAEIARCRFLRGRPLRAPGSIGPPAKELAPENPSAPDGPPRRAGSPVGGGQLKAFDSKRGMGSYELSRSGGVARGSPKGPT